MKIYDNVGTIKVDYRMQYYDVITNPTWLTAANKTIFMIMIKFGTRNESVRQFDTTIKQFDQNSKFSNSRGQTDAILAKIVYGH